MKKVLYVDICDNLRMFSIIERTKDIKKKISNLKIKKVINFFLLLKYRIYKKFNVMKFVEFDECNMYILYSKRINNKKKLIRILNRRYAKDYDIVISKEIKKVLKTDREFNKNDKSQYIKNIDKIISYVVNRNGKEIAQSSIYFIIKNNNHSFDNLITKCAISFGNLYIVTENIEQFKNIEYEILNKYGIYIVISNNKRKALTRAEYTINIDNDEDSLNKYNINRNSIIFNLSNNLIRNIRGFEGYIINNIEYSKSKEYNKNEYIYSRFSNHMNKQTNNDSQYNLIGNNGYIIW